MLLGFATYYLIAKQIESLDNFVTAWQYSFHLTVLKTRLTRMKITRVHHWSRKQLVANAALEGLKDGPYLPKDLFPSKLLGIE